MVARSPTFTPAPGLPADVRLMLATANAVFVLAGLALCAAVLWWAARLPIFAIRGIRVDGEVARNSESTIRANAVHRLTGNFVTLDLQKSRAAFEAVPWVRHAVVRRQFPNRLQVVLQEHQAVAYWGSDNALRLINNFGEVFEANVGEVEQDALPSLNGPEGQGAEVLAMYRAVAPLFEHMEMPVDGLELSVGGSWRVLLDTGAAIELGRGGVAEISARVRRFLATLTQVTSRYGRHADAVESADLRHENGYAIRLRGVSTVVAAVVPKK